MQLHAPFRGDLNSFQVFKCKIKPFPPTKMWHHTMKLDKFETGTQGEKKTFPLLNSVRINLLPGQPCIAGSTLRFVSDRQERAMGIMKIFILCLFSPWKSLILASSELRSQNTRIPIFQVWKLHVGRIGQVFMQVIHQCMCPKGIWLIPCNAPTRGPLNNRLFAGAR